MLFEELEKKTELARLLDLVKEADGVCIFIGAETQLFSLSESALILSPFKDAARGLVGVVGGDRAVTSQLWARDPDGGLYGENHCQAPQYSRGGALMGKKPPKKNTELAQLQGRLMRALADAENARKQAAREKQEIAQYAMAGFARDMLPILDSLKQAAQQTSTEALKEAIEATQQALQNALARHDVQPLQAQGHPFDARYHEALLQIPQTDVPPGVPPGTPPGTVVVVLEEGYMIGKRLLRPARVGVAAAQKDAKEDNSP